MDFLYGMIAGSVLGAIFAVVAGAAWREHDPASAYIWAGFSAAGGAGILITEKYPLNLDALYLLAYATALAIVGFVISRRKIVIPGEREMPW